MLFEHGPPANTMATLPTRTFRFVIDPPLLTRIAMYPLRGIGSLIRDLGSAQHGVNITLVYPDYLAEHLNIEPPSLLEDHVAVVPTAEGIPPIEVSQEVPGRWRKRLKQQRPEATTALALLALAEAVQADGVVTESALLVPARYPLYQHHRVRIVPPAEFGD